jgi:hypothetical protein
MPGCRVRPALIAAFGLLLLAGAHTASADETIGEIQFIGPETLDFGDLEVGVTASLTFQLRNLRGVEQEIEMRIPPGSPFSIVGRKRIYFEPGLTEPIPVTVEFAPQVAGDFQAGLAISALRGEGVIPLRGAATGGALVIEPMALDFGDVLLGSKPLRSVTIRNVSDASVTISAVSRPGRPFQRRGFLDGLDGVELPHILGVGKSIEVLIRFKPKKEGSYSNEFTIESDGFPAGSLQVPVRGNAVSELGLSHPRKLKFGRVAANVFHERSMLLRNNGTRVLTGRIITRKLPPEYFTIRGDGDFALEPGETREVSFRFGSRGNCRHDHTVKIVSDGLRKGKARVKVLVESVLK